MPATGEPGTLSLEAIREKLSRESGPAYWRSLDELAEAPEFEAFLRAEFPQQAASIPEGAGPFARREFLKLMGASLALAGLGACTRQPAEKIVPAVRAPEETPGKPLYFATAMPLSGFGTGLLVQSHEGRPTKVEGNPDHPASLGATDLFGQASVLTLYDPDRSQVVRRVNEVSTWERFTEALRTVLEVQLRSEGAGLRILTGTVTSPTASSLLDAIGQRFPRARVHFWDPQSRDNARAGARLAYGEPLDVVAHPGRADVIVSLDGDFLTESPDRLRHIREIAARRRPSGPDFDPLRLYVVESVFSLTGSVADERLPMRASRVEAFARQVARRVGVEVDAPAPSGEESAWVEAVARDLAAHRGASLVMAGEGQPPIVHALALAMNERLGNVGRTAELVRPITAFAGSQMESIASLTQDMRDGRVEALILLDVNPVYDAPVDLHFGDALGEVGYSAALSLYDDETSRLCHWHLPAAHFLEAWGDVRSGDGTTTILQPLIAPLYQGKSELEVLAALLDRPQASGHDLVRENWRSRFGETDFEAKWELALRDGVVADTRAEPVRPSLVGLSGAGTFVAAEEGALEVTFRPHPTVGDGRFANNGWLQECPSPLTKLTWDNAVLVAPATAERLGVGNGDVVELALDGRAVEGAVWVLPGQPPDSLALHLGYGRTRAGKVGTGRGFDAYRLRTTAAPWFATGVEVRATGGTQLLACTQHHGTLEGRHVIRPGTVGQYRENPDFAQIGHVPGPDESLYPNFEYDGHAWGVAVDLSACVGCNACLVACQAENNVAVVGPEQVALGREMHWLRVDRYWVGPPDRPEPYYQPMFCQHCEKAPCEVVCPVNATVHDGEGLNLMVYNRCVGTRYCSNNCPYKVRRFNFYLYSDWTTESLKLLRNPDVTVRSRGVMEKCTYCIQRINRARNVARKEGRDVRDGEIATACQQVCPAEAIVFGDVNDPESRVAKRKADSRNYPVLAELNTRPRTTYLASVRNPNPELHRDEPDTGGHA